MKKLIIMLFILIAFIPVSGRIDIAKRLSGRILLQVQENGQAWYIDPVTLYRHYLGRPSDAFDIMRSLGLGITNKDLEQIPINNNEENIITPIAQRLAGRIVLQVEENGEAWYINSLNFQRYYLGRPFDAFNLMRELGLGITNADLAQILDIRLVEITAGQVSARQVVAARNEVINLINQERKQANIDPLIISDALNLATMTWINAITYDEQANYDISNFSLEDLVVKFDYYAVHTNDFLLVSTGGIEAIFDLWLQEEGNLEAILDTRMTNIGMGYWEIYEDGAPSMIWTITLAQEFDINNFESLYQIRVNILNDVNERRAKVGLPFLKNNDLLERAAQKHAQNMLVLNFYDHTDPNGDEPLDRVLNMGYKAKYVGENIATGQLSAEDVSQGWYNSELHRDNILSDKFDEIGIGFVAGEGVDGYKTYWVQEFGSTY